MLVELDESLTGLLPTNLSELAGLESVLASSYNGEHFLTTSFPVVRSLLKLPLSQKSIAVLNRLRTTISGHGRFPYSDSFTLKIVLTGSILRNDLSTWTLPVKTFSNRNFPQSVIIGENMLDSEAFFQGARQAAIKSGFKENCNAVRDAGGGSQTAVKLGGYLNATNGYCICITDGDYRCPSHPKSAVSKACSDLVTKSHWPSLAMDFHARSIENIIPIKIIEDAFGDQPIPPAFHTYKRVFYEDADAARYLDLKAGLRFCGLKKIAVGSDQEVFWRTKLQKLNFLEKVVTYEINPPPCTLENCPACSIIDGIGAGTLKQVVSHFQKISAHKAAERIETASIWYEIGVRVFHWTLADKPILI